MATYTAVNGRLVCTGTDITSLGIYNALIANNLGSGHVGVTRGDYDHYHFNKVPIDIGSTTSDGSNSIWISKDEFITIDLTGGVKFNIYGQWLVGGTNSDGFSDNGCSIGFTGVEPAASANRNLRIRKNGKVSIKGSKIVTNHAFRVEGENATIEIVECECRLNQICDNTDNYPNATLRILDTRVNNAAAVSVKAFNYATQEISRTKIQSGLYALQVGTPINNADIFKDLEVDSNTYHIAPNGGDCNVVFINPDFTILRIRLAHIDSNDTTTIAFRYNFKVQDASNVAIENAKVYIVDQNGDVVVNGESTDSSGLINSHLFNYDGDTCLQNSTFFGNTKTNRASHVRSAYKYNFLIKSDTITINQDTKDFIALLPDFSITESNKTTVDSYTEIDTPTKFYDRASSYLEDNYAGEGSTIVSRAGNEIDLGSYNLVIDANAVQPFAFDGSQITIKASTFIGNLTTTGVITLTGSNVQGRYTDQNGTNISLEYAVGNIVDGSTLQLYNVTKEIEVVNAVVNGTSYSGIYTTNQIEAGDQVRIRLTCQAGVEAFLPYEAFGVATSAGISFIADQVADEIYNTNGIDGSSVTTLTSDFPNVQIDVDDSDGTVDVREIYARYVNIITSEEGMRQWFGGITAINTVNYQVNTAIANLTIQNVGSNAVNLGVARIYRDDGAIILAPGNAPITQDNGEFVQFIQPQVESATAAIRKNTNLIPALL